ncbi:MAG: hypothetical protein U1A25_01265 [Candidatus Sungbacteria bacterium]|nr:hypothetical protein [Candidatus Sungbacteria bacterium]
MTKESPHIHHNKLKFCISGAAETGHCAADALEKTKALGTAIARSGSVLVTGATTGAPSWGAIGAKEAGGFVIGISPATSEREHVKKYRLPLDYHDIIIYTGFGYSGRNLFLTRAADAVLISCGRMGTLNEFTIAFEDEKPIGVLIETGGMADEIEELLEKAHRGRGKVIFDSDPIALVKKLSELVYKEKVTDEEEV